MGIPYYAVSLNLVNKKCLVVGGGRVAERKVKSLLDCKAEVVVVSPEVTAGLKQLAEDGIINYRAREYTVDDLNGVFIAISATNCQELNRRVAGDCFARNIPINAVDDPEYCSFIVPAIVRRGDLTISISTGGKSPALAKKIRQELEQQYGNEYATLLQYLGRIREQVLEKVPDQEQREKVFRCLVENHLKLLELIESHQEQILEERVNQCLSW
ncbi:MAG: bifunctional precorrin-2 dehydrogenase/sirohydrochlorin ferrochelatase [Clostridia bacterium]|nr:bifunctional precorrin-2 dehydrogenase/sirohydrochlorin ferrochelatase [Clostridia bacterium]